MAGKTSEIKNGGGADSHLIHLRSHMQDQASGESGEVPTLILDAAAVGLFPHSEGWDKYRRGAFQGGGAPGLFEKRGYGIRLARAGDLTALERLEAACWAEGLRASGETLLKRLDNFPAGQLVLEFEGEVAGVVYSQRIRRVTDITAGSYEAPEALHQAEGPVVHLLSINILPSVQEKAWGDQFLEFMLQYCACLAGVDAVVAVTRCKQYGRQCALPLDEYIHSRNERGGLCDPILRFHELHGARIEGLVKDYRCGDTENEGCGVLVSYDIHNRSRKEVRIEKRNGAEGTVCPGGVSDEDFIEDAVRECLGGDRAAAFDLERPLMEMGLDSADFLALSETLSHGYQVALAPSFFFQYNTVRKIICYFSELKVAADKEECGGVGTLSGRKAVEGPVCEAKPSGRAVAVIGMACRLPGGIDTPGAFWECLKAGRSVVGEMPAGRWRWPDGIDPAGAHQGIDRGGFLTRLDAFDAPFFRISPREAETMDPQQRLLLELSWEALEDAGVAPDSLRGKNVGVYVGASNSDYGLLTARNGARVDAHWGTGNAMAVLANRISYYYDFRGPSLVVDTACSSSLVALHDAVASLQRGETAGCLVGGVNVMCHPAATVSYYKAGMLSRDGRCRTFDEAANGYVRAEGAVMLMLKPLETAMADGDAVYAVITGTSCNHGGQAGGLTVPNPEQQCELLQSAWRAAGATPESIGYVETHGTGTSLGDPIEIQGLKGAFSAGGEGVPDSCGLGAVKTNLGHLEAAAGLAGLMKVALCLKHGELVPNINFNAPNPRIDLTDTPFYLLDRCAPWTPAGHQAMRRAGVSSFGSGGANAHAVLEEFTGDVGGTAEPGGPHCIVLSARTDERLRALADRLLAHLKTLPADGVSLADIAHTLQRRHPMAERAAFFTDDFSDLKFKLNRLAEGAEEIEGGFRGHDRQEPELSRLFLLDEGMRGVVATWIREGRLGRLARLWVKGVPVDWDLLYEAEHRPRRLHLPPYPFSDRRYWIAGEPEPLYFQSRLEPMGGEGGRARFATTLTGLEFFLEDHVVDGRKILPGVVYLEMARAAMALAAGGEGQGTLRLSGITWIRPVSPEDQASTVHLVLDEAPEGETGYRICAPTKWAENGEGPAAVYHRGRAAWCGPVDRPPLNVAALRSQCDETVLSGDQCYLAFDRMRIAYGPGHRAISELHAGEDRVLARLALPRAVAHTATQFYLHPSLLDAALQAVILLAAGCHRNPGARSRPLLPFALAEMDILAPCAENMWAWVRYAEGSGPEDLVKKFDVTLCDAGGAPAVIMRGFSLRALGGSVAEKGASPAEDHHLMTPRWVPLPPEKEETGLAVGRTVGLGIPEDQRAGVVAVYPAAVFPDIAPEASEVDLAERVKALGPVDHVIWGAPGSPAGDLMGDGVLDAQASGVFFLFKLVKAFIATGHGPKELSWTIIITSTQAVFSDEAVNPTHAGVHGLMGTVAKEYPRWHVRMMDLPAECDWPLAAVPALSKRSRGQLLAWRDGMWFRRELVSVADFPETEPAYRQGGVYVVIGGAGAIGEAWSRFVIARHGARVIWIGRRPLDAAIQAKLDALAALGPAPRYIQADAGDPADMQRAYEAIRAMDPEINGIVHGAMILWDAPLADLSLSDFQRAYAAKVNTSVVTARIFGREPLDFALFFSSLIVFVGNPQEAHYAAGCLFQDAYARALSREWDCAVKVVNWGYWENSRDMVSSKYLARLQRVGVGFISPEAAMTALDMLVAGPLDQVAFMNTSQPRNIPSRNDGLEVRVYPESVKAAGRDALAGGMADLPLPGAGGLISPELDPFLLDLLAATLVSQGIFAERPVDRKTLAGGPFFPDHYDRWFRETLAVLAAHGRLVTDDLGRYRPDQALRPLADLRRDWDDRKEAWLKDPDLQAQVRLAEACLAGLPEILAGGLAATAVIFPGAAMTLVEGVYQGNAVSDFYNQVLANCLVRHIRHRLEQTPDARIAILEVGAGTGGTTAALLPVLEPYREAIDEYAYTDISKAFLLRAREVFVPTHSFVQPQLFDVETPGSGRDVPAGRYDVVVATNVLHATRNIRRSLGNVKAAMKRGGLLLLNEISDKSVFTHLTFGLLDGWWRNEDAHLRIPGCPGLHPEAWERVLAAEGFHAVRFPVAHAHGKGQQIIAARSDGVVFREKKPAPRPRTATEPSPRRATAPDTGVLAERGVRYFKSLAAKALKMPVHEIDGSQPLEQYGIDSILVVRLTDMLEDAFGRVPSTLLFEVQTIDALATYFMEHRRDDLLAVVGGEAPPAAPEPVTPAPEPAPLPLRPAPARPTMERPEQVPIADRSVAVIGLSGRYPGAENMDAFWEVLAAGQSCISEIPGDRWDWADFFHAERGTEGRMYSRWGGFMADVDQFDPLFFKITPGEAEKMDPQERLFLETAYAGIEDAGYTPATLHPDRNIGVFVGVMNGTYRVQPRHWSIANRVSYVLNFQGPSLAVDTACSSSLTAIHLALESLNSGTCDCAIAGGVSLILDPAHYVNLSEMMMLSETERCRAFGDGADGFVDGEGVGAVVLKPLDLAVRDGDHIYGVIKGSMINAGGKTNGYMVPNPKAQHRVIAGALTRAGIDARGISYVEAHGTGTALGDPIEIAGLTRAFSGDPADTGFCAIGSVKSNIGHCESAAGIAGLTKVLLQLKHGKLVPSLNAGTPNPRIDFLRSPFRVQQTLSEWDGPRPLRAAVSSFGAGGANAHLLVEAFDSPDTPVGDAAGPHVIVLSAADEGRLSALMENLHRFLCENPGVDMDRLAYTLQVGREAMDARLGLLAGTVGELTEKLASLVDGRDDAADVFRGTTRHGADLSVFSRDEDLAGAVRAWIEKKKYYKLLDLWVKGLSMDWRLLHGENRPKRMSLPTYPFAGERYWAPETPGRGGTPEKQTAEPLPETESTALQFQPVWVERRIADDEAAPAPAEHHVMVCGDVGISAEAVAARLKGGRCIQIAFRQGNVDERFEDAAVQAFSFLKTLLSGKPGGKVLVQVLFSDRESDRVFAGLAGLLHTARLENPGIMGQLVRVHPREMAARGLDILMENRCRTHEALVQYRDGRRLVRDWEEMPVPRAVPPALWRDRGVYLITGGAGGLGMVFAEHLAAHSREATLVLSGRSAQTPETEKRLKGLMDRGLKVLYRRGDVADADAVRDLVAEIKAAHGPLTGVLHAAGAHRDNFIIKKPAEEFRSVLGPKVAGTVALDEATRDHDLSFFILFSSIAGALGNAGQADYAAANSFMDAYAGYRNGLVAAGRRAGLTLSVNWPLWRDGGMGLDRETRITLAQETGMGAMDSAAGIEALSHGMARGQDRLLVMAGDENKIRQWLGKEPEAFPEAPLSDKHLSEKILDRLKALFANATKLPLARVDALTPLETYGIDSIVITRLNRKLSAALGPVSKTLFFEYRTLKALADHLAAAHPGACAAWTGTPQAGPGVSATPGEAPPAPLAPQPASRASAEELIAVIGMSGRYARAETVDAYWENLARGRDCVTEIPGERWPLSDFFHPDPDEAAAQGKSYNKWGSFIDEVEAFDPLFFNISPAEAPFLDPQERLFLMAAWEALEDAGVTRERLDRDYDRRVGVFAGITKTGFYLHGPELWRRNQFVHPHTSFASVANRVSYFLNLRGPSMPVDTMCSASLTAVHEACGHLHRGDCGLAIAGGVNLYLHPATYVWMCAQRMLSTGRHCRSFGKGSDGFVPGEGVGVVLLKPLSRAIRDRDHIHAVIRGTHVNHGGRTHGYTVPNPRAQGEVIRTALEKAGVDARTVSYVEAHGTGTRLGDPVEITGLTQAFQRDTADTGFCALGSAKSNLGHLEAAAGIAGLTKVILQMRHKKLVPSLHATTLNPDIDFGATPFVVQQTLADWERPRIHRDGRDETCPRRAGVSSFGAGGTNAHVLVEEYAADTGNDRPPETGPFPVVLSAADEDRLAAYAAKLREFIRQRSGPAEKESVAPIREKLRDLLADILRVDAPEVSMTERFTDYGVEPLHQARLAQAVRTAFPLVADAEAVAAAPDLSAAADAVADQLPAPVDGAESSLRLPDLAYTLQVSREAMRERVGLLVHSMADLDEKLEWIASGRQDGDGLHRGRVTRNRESLEADAADEALARKISEWIDKKEYNRLLAHWAAGGRVDWHALYGEKRPRRIPLPTYPFARDRYWPDLKPAAETTPDSRPERRPPATPLTPLAPMWTNLPLPDGEGLFPDVSETVAVVGASGDRLREIREIYLRINTLDAGETDTVETLAQKLRETGPLTHLVWYLPPTAGTGFGDDSLLTAKERGVMPLFRMIKALLASGYGTRDLGWTVVTHGTLAVKKRDRVQAAHASVHGLMGSLAKEYPHWRIRVADLGADDAGPLRDLFRLPADAAGDAVARRGNEWFRQTLAPLLGMAGGETPYQQNGVYVVIGGAGGVGEVWSRYMIERYRARIFWIGRREKNGEIQSKLDALSGLGPAPAYIRADAADPVALGRAWAEIRSRHPRIHGVVHSAIVLRDAGLARMDEARFRAALAAKVDVCVSMARVMKDAPPDLVIFFSALQSFVKAAGQSNYAAGCTFKDAFARQLAGEISSVVKIVNWGYWGRVGVVATPDHRARFAARGIGSIEPDEGMAALEKYLQSPLTQAALVKWLEN